MALTRKELQNAKTDQDLFDLLRKELERQLSNSGVELFLSVRNQLSPGIRAMAAMYQLDVSMALDDLGWHFGNWHDKEYAAETAMGLRELGANEEAEIFQGAFNLAEQYWANLGLPNWTEWYPESELEKALEPLNQQMWAICRKLPKYGLLSYWLTYARTRPEKVVQAGN